MTEDFLIKLLIILVIIIFSLSIHELGHFIVGKLFKVNIIEYSIGIGPTLFYFYIKNTRFSFRLFLIGAFVLFDSSQLRLFASETIADKEICQYDPKKLNWSRIYHFNWLHKWGNYNWKNIQEYFLISSYAKYKKMLCSKKKGLFLFDKIKNYKKILVLLAGIFLNFILFLIFFGISQISPKIGGGFLINDLKIFFISIGESLFFIKSDLSINLGETHLHFFLIVSLVFNLIIAIFNSIPLPPLDMFKISIIIYEKISRKKLSTKTENIFAWIGLIMILYVTFVPVFSVII